jgi:hypothetical protein
MPPKAFCAATVSGVYPKVVPTRSALMFRGLNAAAALAALIAPV